MFQIYLFYRFKQLFETGLIAHNDLVTHFLYRSNKLEESQKLNIKFVDNIHNSIELKELFRNIIIILIIGCFVTIIIFVFEILVFITF